MVRVTSGKLRHQAEREPVILVVLAIELILANVELGFGIEFQQIEFISGVGAKALEFSSSAEIVTPLDMDEAEKPNHEGWSASDTYWGHWATKAFDGPAHLLALRVARVLCAGYLNRQLREHAK